MKRLFGTDGIRGVAGTFPLDQVTVGYVGVALGQDLMKSGPFAKVIVGRDTRESGHWITKVLIDSLVKMGVQKVEEVGVITTPGLAFLTRLHQFDLGMMISASHNPYEDNGIKMFSKDGFKLSDDREFRLEKAIYQLIENHEPLPTSTPGQGVANGERIAEDYQSFLLGHFKGSLESYRIGLDACNGSAFSLAPEIFRRLGAKVVVINDAPNGRNINHGCGSLHLRGLIDLVTRLHLDLGVAFDGDADRAIFVDSWGKIFDGDYVLHAFSRYLKRKGVLRSGKVVGTIMTNLALEKALAEQGLELIRAAVGDKYVLEAMQSTGANLGGEPSGHIILSDYHTTGDGILTALKLCEMMLNEKVSLRELADEYSPFPQVLDGLRVRKKIPISDVASAMRAIENAERELGNSGRVVVRYSGTEPILRIMAEGENPELVGALVIRLRSQLETAFASNGTRSS